MWIPYREAANLIEFEKEPWEYDFKKEKVDDNGNTMYDNNGKNEQLISFMKYKTNNDGFDTDGSLKSSDGNEKFICALTRDIYRNIWGFTDTDRRMRDKKNTGYYRHINQFAFCKKFDENNRMGPETINTPLSSILHGYTNEDLKNMNNNYKEIYNRIKEYGIKSKDFKYFNTIGNYVLVPARMNGNKGIKWQDYFDTALYKMQCNEDIINNGIEWDYKKFNKYIDMFYLWDYVKYDIQNDNYVVKSLFADNENHNETDSFIEYTYENINIKRINYNNFMNNILWNIKRRGFFISCMLIYKIHCENDEFNCFQNSIINHKFYTINDCLKKIFENCKALSNDKQYAQYKKFYDNFDNVEFILG